MPGVQGRYATIIALLGVMNVALVTARATTVVPMNLPTAADHAGQVIVGRVASARSYWVGDPRRIETEFTWQEVEYLKGGGTAEASETFSLVVPGGTIGTMTMRIAGAPEFAVGERWILFLLPEYRTFPVVGLTHGAFRVVNDLGGRPRVFNSDRQPITRIDAEGVLNIESHWTAGAGDCLRGQANAHVAETGSTAAFDRAIELDAFLDQLRPILAGSRAHTLDHPAGRPVPAVYRPTALRRADEKSSPATSTSSSRTELNRRPMPGARTIESPPSVVSDPRGDQR